MLLLSPEHGRELLQMTAAFAFYEGQLRSIEHEIKRSWTLLQSDVHFTHKVGKSDVKRWGYIGDRTEWIAGLRIKLTRMTPKMESFPDDQSSATRKIAAELCKRAKLEDRLENVDDQIEVFEDTYELANDRISEFSFFRREWELEMWIIFLLILEVVYMAADIIIQMRG